MDKNRKDCHIPLDGDSRTTGTTSTRTALCRLAFWSWTALSTILEKESDGVRKTGWILLEDITEDTDDEGIWCYFDEDGKLVVNQIDRKIDGAFTPSKTGQDADRLGEDGEDR